MTSEGTHYKLFHNGGSTGPIDETADILVHFFVNRLDTYAVQLEDGQYVREDAALLREVMLQHLKGDVTVGAYLVNPQDQTTKCLCFDIDPEHVKDPQQAAATLYNECTFRFSKRAVLLEASRWPDPSFHVWVVFEPPIPAKAARFLGRKIMEHAGVVVELFPKQDEVQPGDYGNLVKLPLGYHRRERKWSTFLGRDLTPVGVKALVEAEGCSFNDGDLTKIETLAHKAQGFQTKIVYTPPAKTERLEHREEEETADFLVKYWRPGQRNRVEMAFLGLCIKRGVAYESARRIIQRVVDLTNDEEANHRLQLVDYHYHNRRSLGVQLLGLSGLRRIVREDLKHEWFSERTQNP